MFSAGMQFRSWINNNDWKETFESEYVQRRRVTWTADFPVQADVEDLHFGRYGEQNICIRWKVRVDRNEAVEIALRSAAKLRDYNDYASAWGKFNLQSSSQLHGVT